MLFCGLASQLEFSFWNLFMAFIASVDVESIFAITWIICPVCGRPGWVFCQLLLPSPILTFRVESKFSFDQQPELMILKDGILKNQMGKTIYCAGAPAARPLATTARPFPQASVWGVLIAAVSTSPFPSPGILSLRSKRVLVFT